MLERLDDDGAGGRVRIRGPFGLSRVARTRVVSVTEPTELKGRAEIGRRTVGAVRWQIEPVGRGSRVTLTARVERGSLLDRAILAVGGTFWLRRVFVEALAQLGRVA